MSTFRHYQEHSSAFLNVDNNTRNWHNDQSSNDKSNREIFIVMETRERVSNFIVKGKRIKSR